MKYLTLSLILSSLVMISNHALAANEGPHGAPQPPQSLLAEVSTNAGFVPPTFAQNWGIRIYSTGNVEAFKDGKITPLATLSPEATQKLAEFVGAVQAGTLVDPNQGTPMCTDAPSTSYLVYQAGTALRVDEKVGCHELYLDSIGASEAIEILKGFERLSPLGH